MSRVGKIIQVTEGWSNGYEFAITGHLEVLTKLHEKSLRWAGHVAVVVHRSLDVLTGDA
jgi:hypothetical protein